MVAIVVAEMRSQKMGRGEAKLARRFFSLQLFSTAPITPISSVSRIMS
jgi:hypothetical protein